MSALREAFTRLCGDKDTHVLPGLILNLSAAINDAEAELTRLRSGTLPGVVEFTDPETLTTGVAEGWAEPETVPTRIDWAERQARALIPFQVVDGRPVSPGPPAKIQRGRSGLGLWGENPMADALVTATWGRRWVLLIERRDGHGWAMPGGSIELGESPVEASARELAEETGLVIPPDLWLPGEPRFVPDPRGSNEAWAVTVVARADLGDVSEIADGYLPAARGADDALRAAWLPAETYSGLVYELERSRKGVVFPAHVDLLRAGLDGP